MPRVKSLIICATPLQVMIAERIVALHPEEEFHALIYSKDRIGDKYEYYAKRLGQVCQAAHYVDGDVFHTPIGTLTRVFWLVYYRLLFALRYRRVSKVYLSSYECIPMRALISNFGMDVDLYTFDDGLMNLLPSAYARSKSDALSRVCDVLRVMQPSEIRSRIKGHYTIYDAPNAAHTAPKKINLFDLSKGFSLVTSAPELVSVFLGQPLFELDSDSPNIDGKVLSEDLTRELGCSLYLPHPRENYRVDGVEYIETPLIAEDYLLQDLEKHPNRCYTIYSYFSTTLMNLKDHPRIKAISCRPASVPERWNESYEFLERMGIEIREFPNI